MNEFWRALRDPSVSTSLTLGAVLLAGLLALAIGWRGVAGVLFVPTQMPFLISGSVGGLAVVGAALALLAVHLERTEAAHERAAFAALQRDALLLLAAAPAARAGLAQRRSRDNDAPVLPDRVASRQRRPARPRTPRA